MVIKMGFDTCNMCNPEYPTEEPSSYIYVYHVRMNQRHKI